MEAAFLYLVIIEIMLAFSAGVIFTYRLLLKRRSLLKVDFAVALLIVTSSLWFVLAATEGRWLGVKASLFVGCLYFAAKYSRQSMMLIIVVVLTHYLEGVAAGFADTKYFVFPYSLIVCGLLLLWRSSRANLAFFYVAASIEIAQALAVGARGVVISASIAMILVFSINASRIFLKYGQWAPIAYLVFMVVTYFSLLSGIDWVPRSSSNFERSSMIFAAIRLFLEYPLSGPRAEFDKYVGGAMDVFDLEPYESLKGVDPHSFLLSIWRDEGAILTMLWFLAWLYYWRQINVLRERIGERKIRIATAMLAFALVQFSLSPPDTETRLMVALILGVVLGLAKMQPPVDVHYMRKQRDA